MIKTENLKKQFDTTIALDSLSTTIEEGRIYGLVGSNGAGKSTLLRLLAGVYRPTSGSLQIDGEEVFDNTKIQQRIFFIPDELYQMPGASLQSLAQFYRALYQSWSDARYQNLLSHFPIPPERKLSACSKGMRRQISIILALSCQPKYLLLDEAFDGLDPVIRVAVRKLIADDILQRGTTVLIASHNLRELEDMCDEVGLLHSGKILFQKDLNDLRSGFAKVQLVARPLPSRQELQKYIDILSYKATGSVAEIVARGNAAQVQQKLSPLHPLLCESVPMTLEEIFITEMEAVGYDYNNVIF